MRVLGVIPARYGSSRFPGKPLTLIHGKTMISRVYQRALQCSHLTSLVVATDDERIRQTVTEFGGQVVMTSVDHPNGTSRCLEAMRMMNQDFDLVVNIQGDEPYVHPGQISELIESMQSGTTHIGTLVKQIRELHELDNQNIVKVVRSFDGTALYFSRSAIPFCKPEMREKWLREGLFLKHIGLYAYRAETLAQLPSLTSGKLEEAESLEQLRWLEHGLTIMTALTHQENHAVDVPSDVQKLESLYPPDDL